MSEPLMVHEFLSRSAQQRPEAPLLIHGHKRSTYGQVESASNKLVQLLVDLGVKRGDRVCMVLPNGLRYIVSYYAILKAGGICVPLFRDSDQRTLLHVLRDSGANALIVGKGILDRLVGVSDVGSLSAVILPDDETTPDALPSGLKLVAESAADAYDPARTGHQHGIDLDRAMIVYTSGSTGTPRGATLSHLNLVANTHSIVEYLGLSPTDRVSVVLPFPYVYGKSLLNTHIAVGGSLVLHNTLMFPNAVLDVMQAEQATGFAGVPSTFALMLNRSDLAERSFPSLRYVTQAGGAMPTAHIRRLINALPHTEIFIMYGATEAAARLSYLPPADLPRKMGSIGRAIPKVELKVLREDGSEADVREVGELVARGSNIMEGYWADPEGTAAVLSRTGFRTGDLGWRDEEGFLWLAGRKREMIKSGGHRVGPLEVEEVLLECEGLEEAAVVGKPDEFLGEAIVAYVILRPDSGLNAEQLLGFCTERLPDYKVPAEVIVRDSLPRTASGKVDKVTLRSEQRATG